MPERKTLTRVEVKDEDRGEVEAVFATFNVIDSDKDVTLPGAFEDGAPVRISAYGHRSWVGELPAGRGKIRTTDTEAILEGRFFMDTTSGREHFTVVKELGELQEWSYGYDVIESDPGEFEGEKVRFLKKLKTHEVSPVLLGAGVGTRTLATKAAKGAKAWAELAGSYEATIETLRAAIEADVMPDDLADDEFAYVSVQGTYEDRVVATLRVSGREPVTYQYAYTVDDAGQVTLSDRTEVDLAVTVREKDLQFADHAARVLHGVKAFTDRAVALAALRVKEGRVLSAANRERLSGVAGTLRAAADDLDGLLTDTEPAKDVAGALLDELVRFETSRVRVARALRR